MFISNPRWRKAEHLRKGDNPRFVVTSLSRKEFDKQTVYEKEYCGRGDMENRIKEQQLQLFADRTSCSKMRANELRLWFSSAAYTLVITMRRLGLQETNRQSATRNNPFEALQNRRSSPSDGEKGMGSSR